MTEQSKAEQDKRIVKVSSKDYFCLTCLHIHKPEDYAYSIHKEYAQVKAGGTPIVSGESKTAVNNQWKDV